MGSVTVRGVTWGNDRGSRPVLASIARWAEIDGVTPVEWDVRPLSDFAHGSIGALAEKYDLIILDHPHVGEAVQEKLILALDDVVSDEVLADQRSTVGKSFTSYRWNGKSYGFAIDAACHVAARRADLIDRTELAEVPTWDQLLSVAQSRAGQAGCVRLPITPVACIMSFFSLCANLGEPPCQGVDRFATRAVAEEAFEILRRLAALGDMTPISEPNLLDHMAESDDIGYMPLVFGYCNYAKPGYRSHEITFENIPSAGAGPIGAILGGAGLAISARSEHPLEAARYASWLAAADYQRGPYVTDGGQPGHVAAWNDPAADEETGTFLSSTRATIDASYLRPRYPGYIGFQQQAGEILRGGLLARESHAEVLDKIDAAYRASIAGRNADILALRQVG